ncbi:MAG: cation diffusion facilitator family transporter [Porphyromonas sp.]|nr:cation diffusion facilitator family transporter [Porphyromonas sp.]
MQSLDNHSANHDAKVKAFRVSLWVNTILPPLKLLVGIFGSSVALIADGINSLADILSNLVVYVLLKISGKPRDDDHNYGHGKYETVASFALGAVMILAGIWIIVDSGTTIGRYFTEGVLPERPATLVLIVAIFAMGLKEWAYHYTIQKARETKSEVLRAEAMDHRSDVFTSLAVLIGAGCSILFGGIAQLMEPVAAIVVAGFVMNMGFKVTSPAFDKLTEGSLPKETETEILQIAGSVEGIQEPHNIRTRMTGSDSIAIEMDVRCDGSMPLYKAHDLSIQVEDKLRERFGTDTHIIIHIEPIQRFEHKVGAYKEVYDDSTK